MGLEPDSESDESETNHCEIEQVRKRFAFSQKFIYILTQR